MCIYMEMYMPKLNAAHASMANFSCRRRRGSRMVPTRSPSPSLTAGVVFSVVSAQIETRMVMTKLVKYSSHDICLPIFYDGDEMIIVLSFDAGKPLCAVSSGRASVIHRHKHAPAQD